jgi:hypothetical protein
VEAVRMRIHAWVQKMSGTFFTAIYGVFSLLKIKAKDGLESFPPPAYQIFSHP